MADETVTTSTPATDGDVKTWKRRGLIAAAWAAVAAIVAKQTTQPVEAGADGDVVLGDANYTTVRTAIVNTDAGVGPALHVHAVGAPSCALEVFGGLFGVRAENVKGVPGSTTLATGLGAGVVGGTRDVNSVGVYGSGPSTGVFGEGTTGVRGIGAVSGVSGEIPAGTLSNTIAVAGRNRSTFTGGFGVYGLSDKGPGVVGAVTAAGSSAVVGATNGSVGTYAGAFYGPVGVVGSFFVTGSKSAAVPHPDGSHRLLYSVESPESWFEDFGEHQLECGQADVPLDPDFAALVNPEHYQVFLTQYGGHDDLSVAERTPGGFRVEARDATSAARFGWRVVAKRKDIAGERLATVAIPSEPQLPELPRAHDVPLAPEMRSRTTGR